MCTKESVNLILLARQFRRRRNKCGVHHFFSDPLIVAILQVYSGLAKSHSSVSFLHLSILCLPFHSFAMLPALLYLCATSLLLQTSTATSPTHRISLAASSPTNAANVPHDFVSFSIETVFLDDYNNDFSRNLINSIAQRMSLDPIIRVGGVSGDLVKYEPQQRDSAVCIAGSCPNGSQSIFSLGPSYFNGFTAFSNARITVQAPMGNKTSINETDYELNIALDYVSLAVKALGGPGPKLKAIELGNGANSYDPNGADYARAALKRASAIAKNLTLTGNEAALFEVCETQTSYYEPKNANLSSGPNSFLYV